MTTPTPPQAVGRKPQDDCAARDAAYVWFMGPQRKIRTWDDDVWITARNAFRTGWDAGREHLWQSEACGTGGGGQPPTHSPILELCECVVCCDGEHPGKCRNCAGWGEVGGAPCDYCAGDLDVSGHPSGICPKCRGDWEKPEFLLGQVMALHAALAADPARRQQTPQWVPVGEGMPPEGVEAQLLCDHGIPGLKHPLFRDVARRDGDGWYSLVYSCRRTKGVTHWAPLLSVPGEGDAPPRPPQGRQPHDPQVGDVTGYAPIRFDPSIVFGTGAGVLGRAPHGALAGNDPHPPAPSSRAADVTPPMENLNSALSDLSGHAVPPLTRPAPTPAPTLTAAEEAALNRAIKQLNNLSCGTVIVLIRLRDRLLAAGAPTAGTARADEERPARRWSDLSPVERSQVQREHSLPTGRYDVWLWRSRGAEAWELVDPAAGADAAPAAEGASE